MSSITHGMFGTPVYGVWGRMIQRCTNLKNSKYEDYGGRGITVCERWRKFENFYADMGDRPTKYHSLDRIDVNGDYEPSNCRWASSSQQQRNKRNVPLLEYNGKSQCVRAWAEEVGIDVRTLHKRIKYLGWSMERALTTPLEGLVPFDH